MKTILLSLVVLIIPVLSGFAKVTGMLTGIKGKVGTSVFTMWKGVQVLKTRTIPSNPQSEDQTKFRTCFSQIVAMLKPLAINTIRPLWNPFTTVRQSGWGNVLKANLDVMNGTFDESKLILSKGSLEGVENLAATYDTVTGNVVITWNDNNYTNGLSSDLVTYTLIDDENVQFDQIVDPDTDEEKGEETDTVIAPSGLTATDLYLILTCYRVDAVSGDITMVSDSQIVNCSAPV